MRRRNAEEMAALEVLANSDREREATKRYLVRMFCRAVTGGVVAGILVNLPAAYEVLETIGVVVLAAGAFIVQGLSS